MPSSLRLTSSLITSLFGTVSVLASALLLTHHLVLPTFSIFLLPFLSSWSTQFNLLLLSANWWGIALVHDPLSIELLGTLTVRIACFVLPAVGALALDVALPGVAKAVKRAGRGALPGKQGIEGVVGIATVVIVAVGNLFGGVALQGALEWLLVLILRRKSALRVSVWLPMPYTMATELATCFAVRGVLRYAIHRYVLHAPLRTPLGYPSRYHRSWQHAFRHPFSLLAHYDHPLPYFLGTWLPTTIPPYALRMHIVTYLVWTAIISLEEFFTYSGYTMVPWTVRVTGIAGRMEAHFVSGGKGNFSTWGLLDWVNGTLVGEVDEDGRVVTARLHHRDPSVSDHDDENGEVEKREKPAKKGRGRKKRST